MKKWRVVPAILAIEPGELNKLVQQANQFAQYVQFDIMDGEFVPPRSITCKDITASQPSFSWEAHLMVRNPGCRVADYVTAGARRLIVHFEAVMDPWEVIARIKSLNAEAGLAINPDTSVSFLTHHMTQQLDYLLFLSVYPGYYGRPFIPAVLDKVKECHRRFPDLSIGIDGGIKAENIAAAARAGANEICVGSAIFAQPDPAGTYMELLNLANSGWHR